MAPQKNNLLFFGSKIHKAYSLQFTEVGFTSFLSIAFNIATAMNPLDGKPVNPTSVQFQIPMGYSIVKDNSADLGVKSKIVQIRPTVKAVSTKTSKNFFCMFLYF